MKVNKRLIEVHEIKCKMCGKVIQSLSEDQARSNMKSHMMIHEGKNKKDEKR